MDARHLARSDFLATLSTEYLDSYIPVGGSSVRVAVAPKDVRDSLRSKLQAAAMDRSFIYAHVDSGKTEIHHLEQTFTSIAGQILWKHVARRFVERRLVAHNLSLPLPMEPFTLGSIAAANDEATQKIGKVLETIVLEDVLQNRALCSEFRRATAVLCRASYDASSDTQKYSSLVQEWFQGTAPIGSLKKVGIFKKIQKSNARRMLASTTIFLKESGFAGVVFSIDVSQYAMGKSAFLSGRVFSPAAAVDMNEVIRQFIDGINDYRGALFLFLTDPAFVTNHKLGMGNYEALRLRLTDDVRDPSRANPFAPMVLLGEMA